MEGDFKLHKLLSILRQNVFSPIIKVSNYLSPIISKHYLKPKRCPISCISSLSCLLAHIHPRAGLPSFHMPMQFLLVAQSLLPSKRSIGNLKKIETEQKHAGYPKTLFSLAQFPYIEVKSRKTKRERYFSYKVPAMSNQGHCVYLVPCHRQPTCPQEGT